jgi:hypothetical protein
MAIKLAVTVSPSIAELATEEVHTKNLKISNSKACEEMVCNPKKKAVHICMMDCRGVPVNTAKT